MNVERLFVHTLHDLAERSESADEYTLLMSAALLRKLLLDNHPLIDQVNRTYRLELRFRISDISPAEQLILDAKPFFWSIADGLDPDLPLAYAPFEATRDQFLGRRVMWFQGSWIRVRDVIDHLANVEGGVHRGKPRYERQRVLRAAAEFFSHGGLPGAVNQVRSIGRIAVRGLNPLRDAVIASGAATWASVGSDGSVDLRDER